MWFLRLPSLKMYLAKILALRDRDLRLRLLGVAIEVVMVCQITFFLVDFITWAYVAQLIFLDHLSWLMRVVWILSFSINFLLTP